MRDETEEQEDKREEAEGKKVKDYLSKVVEEYRGYFGSDPDPWTIPLPTLEEKNREERVKRKGRPFEI